MTRVLACVVLWVFLGACTQEAPEVLTLSGGDNPPREEVRPEEPECPCGVVVDGHCTPSALEKTPEAACPSGQWSEEGICSPELPRFEDWACPEGWAPVDVLGGKALEAGITQFSRCEPPEPPESCPRGQMPLLGHGECVPHGPDCPAEGDRWPSEDALRAMAPGFDGRVLYVDPAQQDEEGDGSLEAPFKFLSTALRASEEGDLIALAPGLYTSTHTARQPVAIVGACTSGVVFEAPETDEKRAVFTLRVPALLAAMTITGPMQGVTVESEAERVTLKSLRIENTNHFGVEVSGAEANLEEVFVTGMTTRELVHPNTRINVDSALVAKRGARVVAERCSFTDNQVSTAVRADHFGTELTVRDAIIARTRANSHNETFGVGLQVATELCAGPDDPCQPPVVTVQRALIDRNQFVGVRIEFDRRVNDVHPQTSRVSLTDVIVRDTQNLGRGDGTGIVANYGTVLNLSRTAVLKNHSTGIKMGASASLTMADTLIEDTLEAEAGGGLVAWSGSRITAQRAVIQRNARNGVSLSRNSSSIAAGFESSIEATDLLIQDTQPVFEVDEPRLGMGMDLDQGTRARLTRAALLGNHFVGLRVVRSGIQASTLTAEDLLLSDTAPSSDTAIGAVGLYVAAPDISVTRGAFLRNSGVGVLVWQSGSHLTLTDGLVADSQPIESNPIWSGWGILSALSDGLVLHRAAVVRNRQFGMVSFGGRSALSMTQVRIAHTQAHECDGCNPRNALGMGLTALFRGQVEMCGFEIHHNAQVGLYADTGGHFEAAGGRIHDNGVGVALAPGDGGGTADLKHAIIADNNLDQELVELPLPDPADLLTTLDLSRDPPPEEEE